MTGVSVIITTYDRFQQVQESVASVLPQLGEEDEIVVVDNGLPDEQHRRLAAVLAELGVRLEREPLAGISHARNRGARASRGAVLAFLDDDAVAGAGWLRRIRAAFADEDCDCVGGPVRLPGDLPRPPWFPRALSLVVGELDLGREPFAMSVRCLPIGANLAVRRAPFLACGMFSTQLGRVAGNLDGGEEVLLCRQLLRRGGRIRYLPELTVTHRISPRRLTPSYMETSAWNIGRGDARVERALHGLPGFVARGLLKLARGVVEAPLLAWRRWRGDPSAAAEQRIRWAMIRGYWSGGQPARGGS